VYHSLSDILRARILTIACGYEYTDTRSSLPCQPMRRRATNGFGQCRSEIERQSGPATKALHDDNHDRNRKIEFSAPSDYAPTAGCAGPAGRSPRCLLQNVLAVGVPARDGVRKCVRLALPAWSFHGRRRALTARLAEAGATDAEIDAVVPHPAAMTAYYRRDADQSALAARPGHAS
jgi:hypothetical protein